MKKAARLGIVVLAILLSALFAALYFGSPQYRFVWLYGELAADETSVLVLAIVFLISPLDRRFGSTLNRRVYLPWPLKALAVLALAVGSVLFAFWAVVDLLGGYSGPSYSIATYPLIRAIYDGVGFNRLATPDQQGVLGFLFFGLAVLGFMGLRVSRGIGTALRQGIAFFAAPILMVFELALWSDAPLDMFWHVTTFASWSLDRYLTTAEFSALMNSGYAFSWAGNLYVLSNWFVLFASAGLFLLGILTRRRVSRKPFHRVP